MADTDGRGRNYVGRGDNRGGSARVDDDATGEGAEEKLGRTRTEILEPIRYANNSLVAIVPTFVVGVFKGFLAGGAAIIGVV